MVRVKATVELISPKDKTPDSFWEAIGGNESEVGPELSDDEMAKSEEVNCNCVPLTQRKLKNRPFYTKFMKMMENICIRDWRTPKSTF